MPINWLNIKDYQAITRAEYRRQLPDVDPTVQGHWATANANGVAAGMLSLQGLLKDVLRQHFPQWATGEFLDNWGEYDVLPRNDAAGARGEIVQQGVAGTVIPATTTKYSGGNGVIYTVQTTTSITAQGGLVTGITRSGSTATVALENHGFATGQSVTIADANEEDYNGPFDIIVSDPNLFTYQVSGTPDTPATGTITWASTYASVLISADTTGEDTNLGGGASLTLDDAIVGISESAIADYYGLTGGADVEDDVSYWARLLLFRSSPKGVYTPSQIETAAKRINGTTRAFVRKPELSICESSPTPPVPGQVAVYPLRDNDPSIVPSPTLLAEIKQSIIDYGKLPGQSSEVDLLVLAATLVPTDFTFSSISPDTPTMRDAIKLTLVAFFEDSIDFATDVTEASYLGAIANTQDLITGDFLTSFTLSAPSGDITIDDGEIATLVAEDVTFT